MMNTAKHIQGLQRIARVLQVLCTILFACACAMILYSAILSFFTALHFSVGEAMLYRGPLAMTVDEFLPLLDIAGIPAQAKLILVILIDIAVLCILAYALWFFVCMLREMAQGQNPFQKENAARLQRLSFFFLAISVWNIPLALLLFTVSVVGSYLFYYGAALYDRANHTIQSQEKMILAFTEMVEAKSGETGQHVKRVSEYSRILAKQLKLPAHEIEIVRIAAMMHDIGKMFVPLEILDKPAALTADEFAVVKQHVLDGERLLHKSDGEVMKAARVIALEHHERWDGKGYLGRSGTEIDKYARIVAVADVFDALTSRRPYKAPWPVNKAFEEITAGRGTQFDPAVIDAFRKAWPAILLVSRKYQDEC